MNRGPVGLVVVALLAGLLPACGRLSDRGAPRTEFETLRRAIADGDAKSAYALVHPRLRRVWERAIEIGLESKPAFVAIDAGMPEDRLRQIPLPELAAIIMLRKLGTQATTPNYLPEMAAAVDEVSFRHDAPDEVWVRATAVVGGEGRLEALYEFRLINGHWWWWPPFDWSRLRKAAEGT